jgi:hypothetical protein
MLRKGTKKRFSPMREENMKHLIKRKKERQREKDIYRAFNCFKARIKMITTRAG